MLRKAIANQIEAHGETLEALFAERAEKYGYQVTLTVDEKAGYENLTRSIMHYEGRVKEARSILRMIDDLEVPVDTGLCGYCGHHEVGVSIKSKFRALKPGEMILIRRQ